MGFVTSAKTRVYGEDQTEVRRARNHFVVKRRIGIRHLYSNRTDRTLSIADLDFDKSTTAQGKRLRRYPYPPKFF